MKSLLDVKDLKVDFHTYAGDVHAVRGVNFSLEAGGSLAIVGESGCGKSVSAKAIMGLIKNPGEVLAESKISFEGRDISTFSPAEMRTYKGGSASIIFQEALSALDPTMRVGEQIVETLLAHEKLDKAQAQARALELLHEVGIPEPERRFKQYPHELSGGQRQRVMIAIAFACNPELLICDEPTTALDVTIQDQILQQIAELRDKHNTAVIMITHDMGVVANIAERILVMYAGLIVEEGRVDEVFAKPLHPYTYALMAAVPRVDQVKTDELETIPGSPPDLLNPPAGCPFAARCKYCMKVCQSSMPESYEDTAGHKVHCWLYHPDCKLSPDFANTSNEQLNSRPSESGDTDE